MSLDIENVSGIHNDTVVKIKVIGVGGAGNNAINRILSQRISGVDCISINTDVQVLRRLQADQKIVLGKKLTSGQGAGGRPEVGLQAAEENKEELMDLLQDADMVFIMAGMGGGTGTGAAPYVAKIAQDLGKLVVGVVTLPFDFEGKEKMKKAQDGLTGLRKHVDSLIILRNDKIADLMEEDITIDEAFSKVDSVLYTSVCSVSDLITQTGYMNIDFADVNMVMKKQGNALLGIGTAEGENRALEAMNKAIKHPLLSDVSIQGAQGILVNVTGGNIKMNEYKQIMRSISDLSADTANIKCGMVANNSKDNTLSVTIIATGFKTLQQETRTVESTEESSDFMKMRNELEHGKSATPAFSPANDSLRNIVNLD